MWAPFEFEVNFSGIDSFDLDGTCTNQQDTLNMVALEHDSLSLRFYSKQCDSNNRPPTLMTHLQLKCIAIFGVFF